jgi:hypothetical protein
MWERIDLLLERAPHLRALRFHRVELLDLRRRRAAGLGVEAGLAADAALAALNELAAPALLARARAAWDGRLIVLKGPEVALDYGGPGLRRFGDLDLLVDDPYGAQAALLRAGFGEVGEPARYRGIHHLRPLAWPGLPLTVEIHAQPKWPAGVPAPPLGALLEAAVPSRLGISGVEALPAAHHALLLAAHAWAHEPLSRLGDLIDVAVTSARGDAGEPARLARAWGCERLWRTTEAAVDALLHGGRRSAAVAGWARHLRQTRERTVLEIHLQRCVAPLWGAPRRSAVAGFAAAVRGDARRDGTEAWGTKLARSRVALANAGVARPEHDLALRARGYITPERTGGR